MNKLPAFKAYDIRGKMPHELNPSLAYYIGRGIAQVTGAKTAVLGMDSRQSSPELLQATAAGLTSMGVECFSLGLCGTEEIYHAAGAHSYGVGVMITASHNPAEYNGMKLVRAGAHPFSADTDIPALETATRQAFEANPTPTIPTTQPTAVSHRESYVAHLLAQVDTSLIKPMKIVINAGNGAAGPTADAVLDKLPQLQVIRVHHQPDGTFPNGIPNPLIPENRTSTIHAVQQHGAALGIAWDGDFDRCFLYDEAGNFVSNYYLCGILARTLLQTEKAPIVHDPRLYWDTVATIEQHGGSAHIDRVGHGYIKPAMRRLNAIFGGEISGHFYFRNFFFCDTGMLPWLLTLQLMGSTGQTLGQLVAAHAQRAPASDEINFQTPTPAKEYLQTLLPMLQNMGTITTVDGYSVETPEWRANIRASSNEPLLRLNVEAKSENHLQQQLLSLQNLIQAGGAHLSNH